MDNNKYITKDKQIVFNGLTWFKNKEPTSYGEYRYNSTCRCGCGRPIKARKYAIVKHTGYSFVCGNLKQNFKKRDFIKERLRKKSKTDIMRNMTGENIKLLGELVNKFDNAMDNTVSFFNFCFDEYLGGDQTDIIEIGRVYTHNGRILRRYKSNGKDKVRTERSVLLSEFEHLFFDEIDHCMRMPSHYFYDVFCKSTGLFIKRYKSLITIARDYDRDPSTISLTYLDVENPNGDLDIKVKKIRNKEAKKA